MPFTVRQRPVPASFPARSRLASNATPPRPTRVLTNLFLRLRLIPQRNIELGRVALVNLAADALYGKLVVIVDFVDMNRVRYRARRPRNRVACPPSSRPSARRMRKTLSRRRGRAIPPRAGGDARLRAIARFLGGARGGGRFAERSPRARSPHAAPDPALRSSPGDRPD